MGSNEKSKIDIHHVNGDVVISQNQQGGTTSHTVTNNGRKGSVRKKWTFVGIIAFVSSVLGILGYLDLSPTFCNKVINKNENRQITLENNRDLRELTSGQKKEAKENKVFGKKEDKQISIRNVTGDVVISQNQSGGITAHTININNKVSKRELKNSVATIIAELQKYQPATYRLHYSTNDQEASELAKEIDQILVNAKWQRMHPIQRMSGPSLPKGITVFMLKPVEPIVTLTNQLWNAFGNKGVEGQVLADVDNIFKVGGWPPVELTEGMSGVVIYVGPNPEN